MIWDSDVWKRDLVRRSALLQRRQRQRRWGARSFARLEQDVMLGCFSVRKLIESKKVSDDVANRTIELKSFPAIGKPVTFLNWHRIPDLYDADAPRADSLRTVDLCNQVVHSYVFLPVFGVNGRLASVLFASDRVRNRRLYSLKVSVLAKLFHTVGVNDPLYFGMTMDAKTKDYRVKVGPHAPHDA